MKLAAINLDELKKFATELNKLVHEGTGAPFLSGKKIKTIAVSKEQLAQGFDEAIRRIDDEIINDLPEEIINFYNEYFSEATEEEASGAEEEASGAEEGAEGTEGAAIAPAPAEKPEKEKRTKKEKVEKPKKEKVEKPKKEKKEVEKSVFGHKLGSQAAMLDDLLKDGNETTIKELSEKSGRSELGVKSHIKHLEDDRGLFFEKKDGGVVKLLKG
jgi:hypothetical protein